MAKITGYTYERSKRPTRPPAGAQRLSQRLSVEPRAVYRLARQLDVSLGWLDIASGPDVVAGTPASWEACIALGIDPLTGDRRRAT